MSGSYLPIALALATGALSLAYVGYLAMRILTVGEGTDRMKEVSSFIREGSEAYMSKQYKLIAAIVVLVSAAIAVFLGLRVALAYVAGAACSAIAGFIGLHIAIRANARTANVARTEGLGKSLDIAFKGGSVLGFGVVGVGLIGVVLLYLVYGGMDPSRALDVVSDIAGFSFGASTVALFARVGGGIYTKSADVGADLVGKIERHIPEDDPRNPGVIADNVGDNVGDVAGMGADLFESYVGAMISTMILGAAVYGGRGEGGLSWVLLPLAISGVGILASFATSFTVRGEPERALTRASVIGTVIAAIACFFATVALVGRQWRGPYTAMLCGLAVGVVIGQTSDYFTSSRFSPARNVAKSNQGGPALGLLAGFSMGFYSTFLPIICVAVAGLISFQAAGVYGVAISAVGMLSIAGVIVAADAYGPIVDNAAGIAEQAGLPKEVRDITDRLDSVGNTMKSVCKGFAIGSAALTAIAFFVAITRIPAFVTYVDKVGGLDKVLSLLNPRTFAGLLIGSALPPFFTATVVQAVSMGAYAAVDEIRRQFREIPGLMEGKAKPDYARCVSLVTSNALGHLVLPGALAIATPLLVGFIIGPDALVGMMAGSIASGLLLGLFQGNVGNTWDNAKKYIEAGNLGGKGSLAHSAAVIGDTVGDPMKDSSGPSLNIFIKLMSITALLFAPLILKLRL